MHRILLVALAILALPRMAAAYVDPAAGSLVLQLVLGGVAGLGVALKLSYRRVKALFRRGGDEPLPAVDDAVGRER